MLQQLPGVSHVSHVSHAHVSQLGLPASGTHITSVHLGHIDFDIGKKRRKIFR
jgi:hypothetical protein